MYRDDAVRNLFFFSSVDSASANDMVGPNGRLVANPTVPSDQKTTWINCELYATSILKMEYKVIYFYAHSPYQTSCLVFASIL